jgi:toxin-antitoxin system PIN domain toxin
VKAIDANLLLYAVNEDAPPHRRARKWLQAVLSGNEAVGFSWAVLLAFLRVSTKPAVFPRPLTVDEALDLTAEWLEQPCSVVLHPGERHHTILRGLLEQTGTGGNLTSDAHLAALAIEHGAELCSCDADFSRFPGVRWHNPLK